MTDYPEKTCEIDSLVTHKRLVDAVLEGRKTQQRRNGVYAYPGERFDLQGKTFEVTGLFRESLADMDDAAAQAEGYPSLAMYKDLILRMHKGMEWDGTAKVWVHEFKAV
ncbi:MAG: ASCH domain-containing protein [Planctomycetota bacterium]|nr:ASCH domain-containing protein [Planctomycetota bacterium]